MSGATWLYRTLNQIFVFKVRTWFQTFLLCRKNGKHVFEWLKKQNENKKNLKCIKTKNKPHKQMGLATLLHLSAFFFYLVRDVSQDLSAVLYLQGFQQAPATLGSSLDSSNAQLCCLLHSVSGNTRRKTSLSFLKLLLVLWMWGFLQCTRITCLWHQ